MPLLPIEDIAARVGIPERALYRYGFHKAKLTYDYLATLPERQGKLILVTAISPTPAGEGKTTTSIGLGDALRHIGRKTLICLREPSMGPCFGMKGGATGGGASQLAPADEINLHFTGDFHAITSANNLLSAVIDNHIYWGNALGLDPAEVTWRRALDMNDRALRKLDLQLGRRNLHRQESFDIAVASEVMAIFCLSRSLQELEERLARVIVGRDKAGEVVTAAVLAVAPAMTALLRDALQPNLVQTLEGTPAIVHGGPFANIAHGCNSLLATDSALRIADYVVTEGGFAADLGAEKFFNIKCRVGGLKPDAAVVVATVRALKMHGGRSKAELEQEDVAAVRAGFANLGRHVENLQKFGVPVVVAINAFASDTPAEMEAVREGCAALGVEAHACTHFADGAAGAVDLARAVAAITDSGRANFRPLYDDSLSLADKIRCVATEIYRAREVDFSPEAAGKLEQYEAAGFGAAPVCMAKTQYSFSADPNLMGAPDDFILPVRDVRLSAGAGFVVALCGEILTMPGLPRHPASEHVRVNDLGEIVGLA